MIRDLRLWHAGMPNETDSHRIMLGLGYQVSQLVLLIVALWAELTGARIPFSLILA